jgi:endonuclease YncB( thermonuclease family)
MPIFILTLISAILFFALPLRADDTVSEIISGDEIALQDGRVVRIAGIKAASPDAKNFLESAVLGRGITLQNAETDRYGRTVATIFVSGDSQPIESALLKNGLAFVYPAEEGEGVDNWLKLEHAAIQEKRGFWADHEDTSSGDAEKIVGKYGFVVGVVVKAERIKSKVYINFSADWRTGFTVAIAAHDLRAFKKQGLDPLDWPGKKVRVPGWVTRAPGPTIVVTDPHQIEVME